MSYGVTQTGFAKRRYPELLQELESRMRDIFGQNVIQTEESPLGQLNGVHSDITALLWDVAEDVYQSLDPDQAEGNRLDQIGKLRLLERLSGETDSDFRLDITNADRARFDLGDIAYALRSVDGVTYVKIYENAENTVDTNGLPPHSVAAIVLGGDDEKVAQAFRRYVVPGINTYGNTTVETTIDGFCRSIKIGRPEIIPVSLRLQVNAMPDKGGCPAPSSASIATALAQDLSLDNGDSITLHVLRTAISCRHPNVELISGEATFGKVSQQAVTWQNLPLEIDFFKIASVAAEDIIVNMVVL